MIDHIDHIVLTTRDLEGCIRFYRDVLGMTLESFRTPTETRQALKAFCISYLGADLYEKYLGCFDRL